MANERQSLQNLAKYLHKKLGSTEITVRHSISLDTLGNSNEKYSIFYKRWFYGKTVEEVLSKVK